MAHFGGMAWGRLARVRRSLRWLHFSDLHLAQGQPRWGQIEEDLRTSIGRTVKAIGGTPDLVFLTGDLTDTGAPEQFTLVDTFLDKLAGWVGGQPFMVAVPGNHDVARPLTREAKRNLAFLSDLAEGKDDPDLMVQLWRERDASPIAPLFTPYMAWLERRLAMQARAGFKVHGSHFPGDLRVDVTLPGVTPVTIVGLNSAWLQYRDGDYYGHLVLPREQFHAALGGPEDNVLAPLRSRAGQQNLLLMHHAPSWLTEPARQIFLGEVLHPDYFAAALFGQLRGAYGERLVGYGGQARHVFQAASLFGREKDRSGQLRPLGYAAGTLADDGELRVWPLLRRRRGDHVHAFVEDQAFTCDDEGPHRGSFVLRERVVVNRPSSPPAEDIIGLYLERLGRECSHIQLEGIGHAGEAARYPIEEMYVRLVAQTHREVSDPFEREAYARMDTPVDLAALLPLHLRLLFEGEPGSGKTTFLRYVAHVLREAHYGRGDARPEVVALAERGRVPLPIFARIADVMSRKGASSLARRSLLLDHLAEKTCPEAQLPVEGARDPAWDARRAAWDERLRLGDAVLLLDGLDEVADEAQRRRVFEMLDDATATWSRCRVLVTSRPFSLEELLRRRFHREVVAPFNDAQVRDYARRWVAALYADSVARPILQEDYTASLFAALRDRPEIRRLAENPVMLTCLCVVHWHRKGSLPEGRAEVYREVIHWLLKAREVKRLAYKKEHGIEPMSVELFEEALAALALKMMSAPGGKRVVVDFGWAADALTPLMRRYFPTDDAPSFARQLADLLRFECECSGVLQEQGQGQLKFWHLTFQEYLAARRLVYTDNVWPIIKARLDDRQWRETIDLYPACLIDRGVEQVDRLMKHVLGLREHSSDLAAAAEIVGIAGRLLATLRPFAYRLPGSEAATYETLRKRALGIFETKGAAQVDEETRVDAAEALGRAGDPRLRPETFRQRLIVVPGTRVKLAKYLATVEEFERFVLDGGYDRPELWDDEGWVFRESHGWIEPGHWEHQLVAPNRPVVHVSWFEAAAYCHWLSTPDLTVRLPTRAEWLAVAIPDKRTYPWGKGPEPDAQRANFGDRVCRPTPVGLYPAGDGKFGHSDLLGNVWEWTTDIDLEAAWGDADRATYGHSRQLLGGSWFTGTLRTLSHLGKESSQRLDDRGFRVAAEPTSL